MNYDLVNFFQNKKILITGHTGFKGAWLTQILLNWGAKITGISLAPNTTPNLFTALKIEDQILNHFVDIRNYEKIKKVISTEKPDIVFHLAAQPLVRDSYDDPLYTYETNVIGTANVLQTIKKVASVKAALIITTDKVYENKEWIYPYREIDKLGGYDPYSASKAAADIVSQSYIKSFFNPEKYGKDHHTLVAIARAGNVIGGGDWSKDRLIPDIVRAIYEEKREIVLRNPQSIRPWEHVLESLMGYLILARHLFDGKKEFSQAWNFGPNDESFITVEEITQQAVQICQQGKYKIQSDQSKHEAHFLKLDASKAKSLLDWQPQLPIKEALEWTFQWYKTYYTKADQIEDFTKEQINKFFSQ